MRGPWPKEEATVTVQTVWRVHHQCGHDQEHDLSEKRASERAGFARWLASRDCFECWCASRDAKEAKGRKAWLAKRRAEEAQQIASWEQRCEMPHLDGSDKAVEWGRRVRFDLLAEAYECMQDDDEFVTCIEEPARKITSASWWIDQRDADPESLSELVLDAVANPSVVTGSENPY
jgi:hypothetical protein